MPQASAQAVILFCDLVGYSKLSTERQRSLFIALTDCGRRRCFALAGVAADETDSATPLPKGFRGLPTGDGFALVVDVAEAGGLPNAFDRVIHVTADLHAWAGTPVGGTHLRPDLLRIGLHMGPVLGVRDINGVTNACGATINTTARIMTAAPAGGTWASEALVSSVLGTEARPMALSSEDRGTVRAANSVTLRAKHGLALVAHPLQLTIADKPCWVERQPTVLKRVLLCYPASPHLGSEPVIETLRQVLTGLGLTVVEPPTTPVDEADLRQRLASVDALIAVAVPYDTEGLVDERRASAWVHNFIGAARGGCGQIKPTWVVAQRGVDLSGWGARTGLRCPTAYDPDDRGTLRRIADQTEAQIKRWRAA